MVLFLHCLIADFGKLSALFHLILLSSSGTLEDDLSQLVTNIGLLLCHSISLFEICKEVVGVLDELEKAYSLLWFSPTSNGLCIESEGLKHLE